MRKSILSAASAAALLVAMASGANAAEAPAPNEDLTFNGITIYGIVDMGISYQTHGTPMADTFYPGNEWLISKNSNKSQLNIGPGGLSQSRIGIKGFEEFTDGWAVVFKAETAIDPWSGTIADAGKTLTNNAGVPLAQQTSNGDGARNGEIFQLAYGGISSKTYGTFTLGRQLSSLADIVGGYDPMGGGAYAFAPIDYSGVAAGGGDTQNPRLNQSFKYVLDQVGTLPVHGSFTYQAHGDTGRGGGTIQGDVGASYMGFTVDGVYSHIKDAVSAGALSAAQVATSPLNSLTATISDNTAYMVAAKYKYGPATLEGAFEHIYYANPTYALPGVVPKGSTSLLQYAAGNFFTGNGGYIFANTNNSAYNNNQVLSIYWLGGRYQIMPKLEVAGAWYHYSQNDYSGGAATEGVTCSQNNTVSAKCAGTLNAYSFLAEYKFTKRFEMYTGVMYSTVGGGRASGFLNTNTLDPMVGAKFSF